MPEVSVIIPAFNNARFLGESIQSVLSQTFTDFELLVIDDGSTDDTRRVVDQFLDDQRVRYVFQENRGAAAARNNGIQLSTATLVAFLDADDLWLPDKLQSQVTVLRENAGMSVVHTAIWLEYIDPQNQKASRSIQRRPALREQTLYEELIYRNVITGSASSVLVRRTALVNVGPFDETLRISDRDMWQRLSERHQFFYLDEPLVCIRKHSTNMSNNRAMIAQNHLLYFQKLLREMPPQYHFHLPRMAIGRFTMLTLVLLRHGELRAAGKTIWVVICHVCRYPGAVFQLARR